MFCRIKWVLVSYIRYSIPIIVSVGIWSVIPIRIRKCQLVERKRI
eukprot:SAG22_NODE_2959_length_2073_cov_2.805471_1_plen_45_part_00